MSDWSTTSEAAVALEREARHQAAALANGVRNRKAHPSYGYTKKSLTETLHKLEGLLYAWWTVSTGETSAHWESQVRRAAKQLDVPLDELHDMLKRS